MWEPWGGKIGTSTETVLTGSSAVHVTADRSEPRCGVRRRFEPGIDLAGYDISLAVRLQEPNNEGVSVQLQAPDNENLVQTVAYGWGDDWIRLDHGFETIKGTPDLSDVREIRIGIYLGESTAGSAFFDGIRATKQRDRGLVAFTFDDNHITQYELAFPMLEEYGFSGSIGVIPWSVGNEDRIDLDGLNEMHEAGWRMMSHPQRPGSLRDLSPSDQNQAMGDAKRWLLDQGFDVGARAIVWPLGQYDTNSLRLANRYHTIGFSTSTGVAGRITDPLVVPRVNAGNPERAHQLIDVAERSNQLCVLMFHRIADDDDDNTVTELELRELLDHVQRADVDVVSLEELQAAISSPI